MMSVAKIRVGSWTLLGCLVLILTGCGKTGSGRPDAETASASTTDAQSPVPDVDSDHFNRLPTAAIGNPKAKDSSKSGTKPATVKSAAKPTRPDGDDDDDDDDTEPDDPADKAGNIPMKEGSPEWLLSEATRLRLEPPPKTEDIEVLRASRKERNERIVTLTQQAIEKTHSAKGQERVFNAAVHQLMEARIQLAQQGDRASIDALYADAAALWKRDPNSPAAAEGARALVMLAYSHARGGPPVNTKWLKEFARQASHYASDFPADENRSLPLLLTAARSCEVNGLHDDAQRCYMLIQKQFPASEQAQRVAGILRRIKLPGQPPHLKGPNLDGGELATDNFRGQVVLIVFWAAETRPFIEQLAGIQDVYRKYSRQGLTVLGVNFDKQPAIVNQFLVSHQIAWPQIFFTDPVEQGWNNPIARQFGIMELPTLWLVDRQGLVVSTAVAPNDLDGEIGRLLDAK